MKNFNQSKIIDSKALFLAGVLALQGCTQTTKEQTNGILEQEYPQKHQVDETTNDKENQKNILSHKNVDKRHLHAYNLSKKLVGEREVNFFMNEFDADNITEYYQVVTQLQKDNKIEPVDGIIGKKTLSVIYKKYYSRHPEKLVDELKDRYKGYQEMQYYKSITQLKIPDVFDNKEYMGLHGSTNKETTYFDQNILKLGYHHHEIADKQNSIFIDKIGGKYILAVYLEGQLKILSYASGTVGKKENQAKSNQEGRYKVTHIDKYKISEDKKDTMPYSISVNNGTLWIHGGNSDGKTKIGENIVLPIFYSRKLYELISFHRNTDFNVQISSD